ncbi:MAG: AI-2E family transporter [Chitinivibrionales bacterium]|nr:AI-2E family transporter [Chitinivibrionales bacterium]
MSIMDGEKSKFTYRFAKVTYFIFVFGIILGLFYCARLLFVPLVISVAISFALSPVVHFFETRGMRHSRIVALLFVVVLLVVAIVIFFIVPQVLKEAHIISTNIPHYKLMVKKGLDELQLLLVKMLPDIPIPDLATLIKERIPMQKGIEVNMIVKHLSSFFSILSLIVLVPFMIFFFLLDGHLMKRAILAFVPNAYFEISVLLLHKITTAVKDFIRGQMIDASAVGIMTMIGLSIVGVPYAIVIGIIAGLGNLVPYFGPLIGFVPAIMALILSPQGLHALSIVSVIIVFVVVQFIEGTFVYPLAVGRSVDLHPLVIIIGVTVGGQLGGIVGMLLVIPIISIVKVTFSVLHSYLKSYSII